MEKWLDKAEWVAALLLTPSSLLHELTHIIPAKIFGLNVTDYTLSGVIGHPQVKTWGVTTRRRRLIISFAPLSLYPLSILMMAYGYQDLSNPVNLVITFYAWMLFLTSVPSKQDLARFPRLQRLFTRRPFRILLYLEMALFALALVLYSLTVL
jgi:hypothetical protein